MYANSRDRPFSFCSGSASPGLAARALVTRFRHTGGGGRDFKTRGEQLPPISSSLRRDRPTHFFYGTTTYIIYII